MPDLFMKAAIARIVDFLRSRPGADMAQLRVAVEGEGHTDESFRTALHHSILQLGW